MIQKKGKILKKAQLVVGMFFMAMMLAACGGGNDGNNGNNDGDSEEAEQLYEKSSANCHGDDLEGESDPQLDNIGTEMSIDEIREQIDDGSDDCEMPEGLLEGDDADEVVDWLSEMD